MNYTIVSGDGAHLAGHFTRRREFRSLLDSLYSRKKKTMVISRPPLVVVKSLFAIEQLFLSGNNWTQIGFFAGFSHLNHKKQANFYLPRQT